MDIANQRGNHVTKDKALHAWFNSLIRKASFAVNENQDVVLVDSEEFIPFYTTTSVPDDVVFPYGTYEYITGAWDSGEVGLTVNLWFYTTSEALPNEKADEMSQIIGLGGTTIPCDGGFLWIKRGSPWCQSLSDETSPTIKRRYINVTAEYMTLN